MIRSVKLFAVVVLTVLMLGIPAANAEASWQTVASPTSENLESVFMVSSSEGWAIGWDSVILHYSAGSWSVASSPTPSQPPLWGEVYMVDANEGWAVGAAVVFHYTGGKWVSYPIGMRCNGNCASVFMTSKNDGWMVGQNCSILHYVGGSWEQYLTPAGFPLECSLPNDPLFASLPPPMLYSVYMVSSSEGWVVGAFGTIIHYSAGRWSQVTSPTTLNLYSVYMLSSAEGWAVGENGIILHYASGAWTTYPVNPPVANPSILKSVHMVSPSEGWIAGDEGGISPSLANTMNGIILHYSDGSWSQQSSPAAEYLESVFMVSSTEGWIVGWGGTILHYSVPAAAVASSAGLAFAFMAIGVGAAAAGVGVAAAMSRSEVFAYGGYYYCRKHRVALWYVNGGLWCPIEQRRLRV